MAPSGGGQSPSCLKGKYQDAIEKKNPFLNSAVAVGRKKGEFGWERGKIKATRYCSLMSLFVLKTKPSNIG